MSDALSTFKPKSGPYLKFNDGDEIKLRVLTLDPLVTEKTFTDKNTGDVTISTKYAFVVYNWSEERAQVMEVGPGLLNRFVKIHQDQDLPELNKADIKVSATGEMLARRYDVVVLPTSKDMPQEAIKQAASLKLEELVSDSKGRLSQLSNPDELPVTQVEDEKSLGDEFRNKHKDTPDNVVTDIGDEPVNLDDIPF